MREAGGPFDDPEFKVKFADQPKDKAINGKLLYTQGHPSKDSIKVDAYSRLSEMGGKGPAGAAVSNGSAGQIVYRRGLGSLRLLGAIGMVSPARTCWSGWSRTRMSRPASPHCDSSRTVSGRPLSSTTRCRATARRSSPTRRMTRRAMAPYALPMKGLAKLYGCYEHLKGGRVGSALEDLTGRLQDKLYLRDGVCAGPDRRARSSSPISTIQEELASGALWARLGRAS